MPVGDTDSALVKMVCLDDDAPGQPLDVLWDLEVGAQIKDPSAEGLDPRGRLDPPGHFGAYLHALKWSAVSAADATRFQAPFRAGIKLMAHQLTPLMKALEIKRFLTTPCWRVTHIFDTSRDRANRVFGNSVLTTTIREKLQASHRAGQAAEIP